MDFTPTRFGTVEFTQLTSSLFEQLTEVVQGVTRADLDERATRLKTVLLAVSDTGRGCLLLARAGLANEAVMLFRALGERIVNVCYLMLAAEDEFTRYFNHATYRSAQNLDESFGPPGSQIHVKFTGDVVLSDEQRNAISAFKGSKAKWTERDLMTRAAFVADNSPINLATHLIALAQVWSDGSEALHGSYYGCLFHTGIFEPGSGVTSGGPIARDAWASQFHRRHGLLFLTYAYMLVDMITLVTRPASEQASQADAIAARLNAALRSGLRGT